MSGTKSLIYYWDACVYLAWLKKEETYASYFPSIEEILRVNKAKGNIIITSTITFVEVLESSLDQKQRQEFRNSFKTREHIAYDVDTPIAQRARELREYYAANPVEERTQLSTPDAIHLATATINGTDCLNTFDEGNRKDETGKRGIPLLRLKGKIGTYDLKIEKPFIEFTPRIKGF